MPAIDRSLSFCCVYTCWRLIDLWNDSRYVFLGNRSLGNASGGADVETTQQQPQSLGEKRNWLVQHASGEYVAHFDDDDYYAPHCE